MEENMALPMPARNSERLNLWLYATGKGVSILGSSIYSFAIGLYVLKLTGSALNYATTLMLSVIPMVLISPLAGVIADRLPKKRIVVGMDVINGLLFLTLYFITATSPLTLSIIYVSTVLLNIFTTLFGLGMEAAKPTLVSPDKLIRINAMGKLIDSSSAIIGPMLGGIVFALIDIRLFLLFNALSFLFSAFTECFIKYDLFLNRVGDEGANQTPNHQPFKQDFIIGWQTFKGSRLIVELFFVFVSLNFVLGFSVNVPGPYIINTVLKLPSTAFGFINGLFPVGLIIGTLTVESLMNRMSYKKLLIVMNAFIAILAMLIGLPALAVSASLPVVAFVAYYSTLHFLMGVAIAYVDVPMMTLMQKEIPSALLGRVISIVMSLVKIVLPLALLASGALIGRLPLVVIPIIGGSISLAYSLYLLKKAGQ